VQLISWGEQVLKACGLENARREAEILLAHCLGKPIPYLLMGLNDPVSPEKDNRYRELIVKRQTGYPLQYLTGTQNFMSLDFEVNEGVLIPRWDTEILVERALELLIGQDHSRVVDVGTGSGAIAVSLAKYHGGCSIFALDLSPVALAVAKRNAARHGVQDKITFLAGDFLEPVLNTPEYQGLKFDLVISNPPYIARGELKNLPPDVQREPHLALDGGVDGLDCYRRLVPQAKNVLRPGGYVLLEIGWDQAEEVKEICRANGFGKISVFQDYGQRDRVVSGCLLKG
jgi:release factor glutamine methyltransferase